MAKTPKEYVRLPGTGYRQLVPVWTQFLAFFVVGFFALLLRGKRVQLWQGKDHLLQVESDGASEDYKRFYYQDIQAFILRKTPVAQAFDLLFGFFVVFFAAVAFFSNDPAGHWFLGVGAGLFLVLLVWNLVMGPSCDLFLVTAVQQEQLVSVGRLRAARNFIARLKPVIESVQGPLNPDEARTQYAAAGTLPPMIDPAVYYVPPPLVISRYESWAHKVMCLTAAVDLVGTPLSLSVSREIASAYTAWHVLILVIACIVSLFRQRNTDLSTGLKRLPYVLLGGLGFFFVLAIVRSFYVGATRTSIAYQPLLEQPMELTMTVVSTLVNGIGGIWGWLALRRYHRDWTPPNLEEPPMVPGQVVSSNRVEPLFAPPVIPPPAAPPSQPPVAPPPPGEGT